jgi:heme oxygenase (biliverdin-producing, ferredoxin)
MRDALTLSDRLRTATRAAHTEAEGGPMMQRLLSGHLPLADYCGLLRQLQAIYAALESALSEQIGNPQMARVCPSTLWRSAALAEDLSYLGTRERPVVSGLLAAATLAYVTRLQQLALHDPLCLLAHAYVRYLGDLYGGQMLGRRLRQQHGLTEGRGTRFYEFGDAAQVKALIVEFRAALDALTLSPAQADALVAEACDAFERHAQIFEQLLPAASPAGPEPTPVS